MAAGTTTRTFISFGNNYSALNNRITLASTAHFVRLMNNDIEVINADWLEKMISLSLQANVGANRA
ncbi:hypothetical protein OKW37_006282 [Paraburkholderia sp. MM5482-R2]